MSRAGLDAFARPVIYADADARSEFLKRVALFTLGGLGIASFTALLSMFAIATVPLLQSRMASLVIILGCFGITSVVAQGMVFGQAKLQGFVLGTATEGVAIGYLLLAAMVVGEQSYGGSLGGLALIGQAGGLVALTFLGMVAYLWAAPKNLSMIGSALSVLGIPMLVLMGISFVFPIGGVFGILISLVFVGVSGAGLLYHLNQVIHTMRTDMHVEGAYVISVGVLVLFWNVLSLLLKLTSRD